MNRKLDLIIKKVIKDNRLTFAEAVYLASNKTDIWELMYGANIIRRHFRGDKIHLCSIINAKSGNCTEDCRFCAQSAHHKSKIKTYPLASGRTIKNAYRHSKKIGADGFSIVTSGNRLSNREINILSNTIKKLSSPSTQTAEQPYNLGTTSLSRLGAGDPYVCASVGYLSPGHLDKLKKAGLTKFHHNLETSRRYFGQICSTHSYDERIETVKSIKTAGLKICSGGLFGIGETWQDRIELAFTLKKLDVDSVPLNFLIPVKGTSLDGLSLLSPQEALRIIALYRYILPDKDIRICAGREKVLRDLQSLIFFAGATGMMIGGYLTQPGRKVEDDLKMLSDLGLKHYSKSY